MRLVCLMGGTNSGKTTLLDALDGSGFFQPIFVGRILRKKYPPEFFQGQAAPEKTRKEAWQLVYDGIAHAESIGKVPVLDGQPRGVEELEVFYEILQRHCILFSEVRVVSLFVDERTAYARAMRRDADNPGALALSLERMKTEAATLTKVVACLKEKGINTKYIKSTTPDGDYQQFHMALAAMEAQ
jgi:dephospho-CoA kinase